MKVEHSTHNFPFIFVSKYLLDWHDWYVRASASVHGGKPSKENTDPFFHIYYMFHVIRRNKGKDKYKKGGRRDTRCSNAQLATGTGRICRRREGRRERHEAYDDRTRGFPPLWFHLLHRLYKQKELSFNSRIHHWRACASTKTGRGRGGSSQGGKWALPPRPPR